MSAPIRMSTTLAALAGAVAACSPSVPDAPTWAEDVRPILVANCIKCHTPPALGGAPPLLRLDSFEDTLLDDGRMVGGAATFAGHPSDGGDQGFGIAFRVDYDDELNVEPMPPRFPLRSRQREVLTRWAELCAVDPVGCKGPPRSGNSPPTMTAELDAANLTGDGFLVIPYEIRDPDFDIVLGELFAGEEPITRELHSGRGEAIWDLTAVAEGVYDLVATLDDGSERVDVALGSFEVIQPAGGPASGLVRQVRITGEAP